MHRANPAKKYSITGISRIPASWEQLRTEGKLASSLSLLSSRNTNVYRWLLYCFHSEISHVLDHVSDFVASLSFSRYFFPPFFPLSFPSFFSFSFYKFSVSLSFAALSLSFPLFFFFFFLPPPSSPLPIGVDSECQQCSTKVDARCVCYWIPSRIPFSRRAAVSRNKLIEILLSLWNIPATSFI